MCQKWEQLKESYEVITTLLWQLQSHSNKSNTGQLVLMTQVVIWSNLESIQPLKMFSSNVTNLFDKEDEDQ